MKNLLNLLQIADSALPIGGVAHSFGLETLVAEGYVNVDTLEGYLAQILLHSGLQEGWGCRQGHQLGQLEDEKRFDREWRAVNETLSALRPAHELRSASSKIGRRLLQLIGQIEPYQKIQLAWQTNETHQAPVFGLIGSLLEIEQDAIVTVYLQQMIKTQVAAAQKLLPLGQNQATQIVWRLKPIIEKSASKIRDEMPAAFPGLTEMAALRHPHLPTRLFIS
ncbi:MAG: urease accessory UreF family protein [Chloroflexota bacterium]